jgi:hypothetical protein
MSEQQITDWSQLQKQIRSLLERVHADPLLTVAAATNPLFALEELGYTIDPVARPEIEDRLRFDLHTVAELKKLRGRIFEQAGHPFEISEPDTLGRVLFEELKIRPPGQKGGRQRKHNAPLDTRPLPLLTRNPDVKDPLEVLRGTHPIVEPLLAYRRLEAGAPRLASRKRYDEVRRGELRFPVERIRGRLKA